MVCGESGVALPCPRSGRGGGGVAAEHQAEQTAGGLGVTPAVWVCGVWSERSKWASEV